MTLTAQSYRHRAFVLLFLLLVTRLITMAAIPLNDDTEARYGEVARKMVASGDWITLHSNYGTPFWAKPPLSTWVSALSMKWFGVSEFTARLPNLLLMVAAIAMIGIWIGRKQKTDSGILAALIMASMLLVYVVAGTVMTDTTLLFATTLSLIAFWEARHGRKRNRRLWGYVLFASFGIGMLAKGPVAIVLPGLPIFFWALWQRDFIASVKSLPWVGGLLLMCAIFLPWYLMAEHRTPGFLHYFFIDENFKRYLTSGWGDRYGSDHLHPMGTIVLFWLEGAFPWSLVCLVWLVKRKPRGWKETFSRDHGFSRYLLMAALMPLVFFFFARNIIATYPLEALPPLAALMAWLYGQKTEHPLAGRLPWLAVPASLIGAVAFYLFCLAPVSWQPKLSQKPVIAEYNALRPSSAAPIGYYLKSYYSASFYSGDTQHQLDSDTDLARFMNSHPVVFIVARSKDVSRIPASLRSRLAIKKRFNYVTLLESKDPPPAAGQ